MGSAAFALVAAAGCALAGALWAKSLSRRVRVLRAWSRVVAKFEAGIALRAHTMNQLLERAAEGEPCREVRAALTDCAARMRDEPMLTLSRAMGERPLPDMTDADRAALSPLWAELGASEEAAQRALLQSVAAGLNAQIQEAAEAERKDRRLAMSLGVIGGMAVFLFLI